MATLEETLLSPAKRPAVIRDCATLVDEEVAKKGGLSGLAIKGAFMTVKAIKPGFIESVISALLDDWVRKLEGHYGKWIDGGKTGTFGAFCSRDASAVAERLLEVTDARIKKADPKVGTLYGKLRPNAKDHVIAAVPGLGRVVDRHA